MKSHDARFDDSPLISQMKAHDARFDDSPLISQMKAHDARFDDSPLISKMKAHDARFDDSPLISQMKAHDARFDDSPLISQMKAHDARFDDSPLISQMKAHDARFDDSPLISQMKAKEAEFDDSPLISQMKAKEAEFDNMIMEEKYNNPYNHVRGNQFAHIDTEDKPHGIYLIIHGAGYHNAAMQREDTDLMASFKFSAHALKDKIKKSSEYNDALDHIEVVHAPNTESFVKATNKKYEKGKIIQLDIFSHGSTDLEGSNAALSLGGTPYEGDLNDPINAAAKKELGDYKLREISPETIEQIDVSNFSFNAKVTLWGCNTGGKPYFEKSQKNSISQRMAEHLGTTVKGFVGSSEFKEKNGKIIFDGEMIRTSDEKTQKVILTEYKGVFNEQVFLRRYKHLFINDPLLKKYWSHRFKERQTLE